MAISSGPCTVAPLHIHVHAVARYYCFRVNRGVAWLSTLAL
jgi:hypothetical protein